MKRIAVITNKPVNNTSDDLKEKEMEFIKKWKTEGILESFFIKSDKEGAILIFKDLEMEQVVKNIESLPFFPYMVKVEYENYDKVF
jgi:hypothetical protein